MNGVINRRRLLSAAGATGLISALPPPASAAPFVRNLDLTQGFGFSPGKQTSIGYITQFALSTGIVPSDIGNVVDPTTGAKAGLVMAVLSQFQWDTSATGTISLTGRASAATRQLIMSALGNRNGPMTPKVSFNFVIFDFDPVAKRYFRSAVPAAPLSGLLELSGDRTLALRFGNSPATEVQNPLNYIISMSIKPAAAQSIVLATNARNAVTTPWGFSAQ